MRYLEVGTILTTHGIKGEVKVNIITDDITRFNVGNKLYILKDNKYEPITIDSFRIHKNMALITFNNIKDINLVLPYIKTTIYVNPEELESNTEGFYFDDLIGLEVFDSSDNNKLIGKVIDVLEVPQGSILRVKKENGKNALIPFVDEFIKNVDLENSVIEIASIEGLLW